MGTIITDSEMNINDTNSEDEINEMCAAVIIAFVHSNNHPINDSYYYLEMKSIIRIIKIWCLYTSFISKLF